VQKAATFSTSWPLTCGGGFRRGRGWRRGGFRGGSIRKPRGGWPCGRGGVRFDHADLHQVGFVHFFDWRLSSSAEGRRLRCQPPTGPPPYLSIRASIQVAVDFVETVFRRCRAWPGIPELRRGCDAAGGRGTSAENRGARRSKGRLATRGVPTAAGGAIFFGAAFVHFRMARILAEPMQDD